MYAAPVEDEHVVAWNLHHDEQIEPGRQATYETCVAGAGAFVDWNAGHSSYVKEQVNVDRNGIARTFDSDNKLAQFGSLEENQWLLRVERLNRAFASASQLTGFDALERAVSHSQAGDPTAQAALDRFMVEWNQQRDGRPQFASFKGEVVDEFDSVDWPNKLRDRLGLGHFNPAASGAIEVAVMVYPASCVTRQQRRLGSACTAGFSRPTVVDSDLNLFFYPIPLGANYGAALHLAEGCAGVLTQEVLHLSFDYSREHIKKIGRISSPCQIGMSLSAARNHHLGALKSRGFGTTWTPHP